MHADPVAFAAGLTTAGYLVVAAFFLKFWRRARENLFLIFAFAYFLLALNAALPVLLGVPRENQAGIYLLRAGGFALIIGAILMKNFERKDAPPR